MRPILTLVVLALCTCCAAKARRAMAVLYESSDQKGVASSLSMVGIVEFSQAGPAAKLVVDVSLFSNARFENGLHGFHIHQMGNVYGGCAQTLGHYNPLEVVHGGPSSETRHKGDFGNIEVVNNAFTGEFTDSEASLYGRYSIIGRGVVLHEGKDDLGAGGIPASKTTGNAGGRLACGVIGINSFEFDNSSYKNLIPSLGLILIMTLLIVLLLLLLTRS